jgi:tRNA/rRNA methyltransferase
VKRTTFTLVEPREDGNVGMVARAMANFGLSRLVLVGASEKPDSADFLTARAEGRRILETVSRVGDLRTALSESHAVVAVSRRGGKHRPPDLSPSNLGEYLRSLPHDAAIVFVFGREADGLRAEEAALCGRYLAIPTSPEAPSLNLAQAATIVAFSLFSAGRVDEVSSGAVVAEAVATQAELEDLFQALEVSLSGIGFLQGDRAADTLTSIRRLISRSLPSAREVRLLRSLARKIGTA